MEARKRAQEKQRLERGWTVEHVPVKKGRLGEVNLFKEGPSTTEVWVPPARKPRQKKAKQSTASRSYEQHFDFGEK